MRLTHFRVGVLVLLALIPLLYLGFTKDVPFTHGFRFQAVFGNAVHIRPGAPVRIAGVTVGEVVSAKRYPRSQAAVVEIELRDEGLPVHRDARLKIRSRLFLEGNFFVDLAPGSPSAADIDAGDTIPLAQTSSPVQLDEVLSALDGDTREGLQDLLDGYGGALTREPTAADDRDQDPRVHGRTAAESLHSSYRFGAPALRDTAIVADAVQGTEPRDLSQLIASLRDVNRALGRNEGALGDLISNLDTTLAAFADRQADLRTSIAELPATLRASRGALDALRDASPPARAFARDLTRAMRELPSTFDAAFPAFDAASALLGERELGAVARDLRAVAPDLHGIVEGQIPFLRSADRTARCGTRVVLPTLRETLEDSGMPNFQELFAAAVGTASEGQGFDGNGGYLHLASPVGDWLLNAGPGTRAGSRVGGFTALPPLGTRPRYPGSAGKPPFRDDVACHTQARPDLNGPLSSGPADDARRGR